jgi:WD40 repeat protein
VTQTATSPYRGLASFGESELDGLLFFGRERETEIVAANLLASRLTVLYGPSGVGKSSLVRAGVARRLRELGSHRAPARGPDLACVVFASWADDPVAALGEAIGAAVRPLVSPTAPEPPRGARLADVAEHWSTLLDGDLCLVLDQLEEQFVYREGGALIDELPDLVLRPGLRANVLLSIRDDELARLGALKTALPDVFANARRLDRLDRDAGRAAILGPLQRWNELEPDEPPVEAEPELVEAVLDQVTAADGTHVEAPYLQLVLERVWHEERSRGSRLLRRETLAELGGADALARDHLGRALDVLDPARQETAARMLGHLVTPSGTKIAHRAADLAAFAQVGEAESRELLETLGRDRIVRPVDDAAGMRRRYEIYHDVLAEPIVEWEQRRALTAERRAAHRRQRRLLVLAGAAGALALVLAAITVYALVQRSEARDQTDQARSTALAAGALAALPTDPELGVLLSRDAAAYGRSPTVESALREALMSSRARAVLSGNARGVLAAGFSRGRVVTVDGAGRLLAFPARTSSPTATTRLGGRVRAAAVSANGAAVVVARRRLVELRSLTGGRSFAFRVRSPVRAVAVDGLGDRVAVAELDGDVVVRTSGRTVAVVHPPFAPTALALDRAGRTLAAGGGTTAAAWKVARRRRVARVAAGGDVTGVALAPDGSLLAAATTSATVGLWTVPGGALRATALSDSPLTTVTFDGTGAYVAAGSADGRTHVFKTAVGQLVAVLARHADAVTAVAFSRDGRLLVTGSRDGTARLWDPGVAPELHELAAPRGCCTALASGPHGVLVAAGRRTILYVHGRQAADYRQPAKVTAVAWNGPRVVTGGADGRVRSFPSGPTFALDGPISAVAATSTRVAAATRAGVVAVYGDDGRRVLRLRERAGVAGLALSHDDRLLATAGSDDVARIRSLETGALVHALTGHTKPLTAVAFSPDGSLLATASFDHDVRTWDVASGALDHVLRAHFAVVSDVAFSPDGRWLVTAGPTTAGLWAAPTGQFLLYLRGPHGRVVGAGFAADGRTVAAASVDGSVRAYRCDVCDDLDGLLGLADRRLAATGRELTPAEREEYLTP